MQSQWWRFTLGRHHSATVFPVLVISLEMRLAAKEHESRSVPPRRGLGASDKEHEVMNGRMDARVYETLHNMNQERSPGATQNVARLFVTTDAREIQETRKRIKSDQHAVVLKSSHQYTR